MGGTKEVYQEAMMERKEDMIAYCGIFEELRFLDVNALADHETTLQ